VPRFRFYALLAAIAALSLVACDEQTVDPPVEDPPEPLLEGDWTLRVRPDGLLYDPFLVSGTFAAAADSVVLSTMQGDFRGLVTARHIAMEFPWEEGGRIWLLDLSVDVAEDGESLTGNFYAGVKSGDDVEGTVFGVPGDEVPQIDITVSPSSVTVPQAAQVQMLARIDGYAFHPMTWSLDPPGAGTLNGSGRYTAPAVVPDPPRVTVTATSSIDIGASDEAVLNIEAPAPTCQDVYGEWGIEIWQNWAIPEEEPCWVPTYWQIAQLDCDLILYDEDRTVELEIVGGYAHGVYLGSTIQYTYNLLFQNGNWIAEGSGIETRNISGPAFQHFHPVRGHKIVIP